MFDGISRHVNLSFFLSLSYVKHVTYLLLDVSLRVFFRVKFFLIFLTMVSTPIRLGARFHPNLVRYVGHVTRNSPCAFPGGSLFSFKGSQRFFGSTRKKFQNAPIALQIGMRFQRNLVGQFLIWHNTHPA